MNRFLIVVWAAFFMTAVPALAQPDDVTADFRACMRDMTQQCVWTLGDQLAEAGGVESGGTSALDSLTDCLLDLTSDCLARAQENIQAQVERNAANPAAAAMRDICLADPSPECLMTFAMAYANTPFIDSISETLIEQALPFGSDGRIVLATGERSVSSGAMSGGNLMHMRWLLAKGDTEGAAAFITSAAFVPQTAATGSKLLAIAQAKAGAFDLAFGLAQTLYVDDVDWTDRFEMVMHLMAYYAVAAPDAALPLIEQLTGTTDQAAGYAGLAIALARSGRLEEATGPFDRAMAGIALNTNTVSRDDGLVVWARELASAGAFALGQKAVQAMTSELQAEWTAYDVANPMFGAGQQDEALEFVRTISPDGVDYRYYDLALNLGRTDLKQAGAFVDGLEGEFQTHAAQGYVRALFETGKSAEAIEVSRAYGFALGDSPSYSSDIPELAAILAAEGRVPEAVSLAASSSLTMMAVSFAAIAVELKDGDWPAVQTLSDTD